MRKILLFLLCMSSLGIWAKQSYIIVHGTLSFRSAWYEPGGGFYNNLIKTINPQSLHTFTWSGNNNDQARMKAAHKLSDFIMREFSGQDEINLITHSHGSNVAFLASKIMGHHGENIDRIHSIYAFGTPISMSYYPPDMSVIQYVYNFFSFFDMIQPVLGLYEREFPLHERIANLVVTINKLQPLHTNLHHPLIGYWLPSLIDQIKNRHMNNFHEFCYEKPGIIHFSVNKAPVYEIDVYRQRRQEHDKLLLKNRRSTVWVKKYTKAKK